MLFRSVALFGGPDFVGLWGMYSIYLAWKYAKLWTDGYDWRDVLKEPRDRMFFDVVAEWSDSVRAIWDPRKRAEVRERERRRGRRGVVMFERAGGPSALPAGRMSPNDLQMLAGSNARGVKEALRHRDEILRLIETLSKRDRELLGDVPTSAMALYGRIETLAIQIAEMERSVAPDSMPQLDRSEERRVGKECRL